MDTLLDILVETDVDVRDDLLELSKDDVLVLALEYVE